MFSQKIVSNTLEERLIRIFQAFVLVRLVAGLVFFFMPRSTLNDFNWTHPLGIMDVSVLFVYLFVPKLHHWLGKWYLAIAIVWATLMPLLVQNVTLYAEFERLASTTSLFNEPQPNILENASILGSINQTLLVLIVPLIQVAWGYSRRTLIMYCVVVTVLDLLMTALFIQINLSLFLLAFALIIFRTLLYAVIGTMVNELVTLQLAQQQKLIDANEKLKEYADMREELATSNERNRIARELHDTLAHTLSAATVQLEAVNIIWEKQPDKAQQMVTKSASLLREGLAETRRALQALRAGTLDTQDLISAITTLSQSLMTRYPVNIHISPPNTPMQHNSNVEHGLYRIVQEALMNAVQHAEATQININIQAQPKQWSITVVDNGVGFDTTNINTQAHFGIKGMHERAAQIHAHLQLESQRGHGTTVKIVWTGNNDDTHSYL
jgi:signal transduction histidine kinase